jgi:hypothetical protein
MYRTSEPMLFRDRPSMSIAALLGLAHCQHHSLAYCFIIGLSAVEPCIFLLIMTFSGQRHREQEYGYLSYNHYILLSLEQVDSLVSQKSSALVGSPSPSFSPAPH